MSRMARVAKTTVLCGILLAGYSTSAPAEENRPVPADQRLWSCDRINNGCRAANPQHPGVCEGYYEEARWPVVPIRPEKDKETRVSVQTAKFEGGQVYLPNRASWLGDYETELFSFPGGVHDDQVDSTSQFLEWASAYVPPRIRRF